MNIMRIAILGVALLAAALTAFLVRSLVSSPSEVSQKERPPDPTTQVLVATRDLEIGTKIAASDMRWQVWPEAAIAKPYFTVAGAPKAPEELTGGIVRAVIYANSPITLGKILKTGAGGFMSAILEGGKRAVGVKVTPDTGAAGFILPGDRVDVLHATRPAQGDAQESPASGVVAPKLNSRTIIENVRVLAIDQTVSDPKAGAAASSVIGKTATLELSPEEAEILASAAMDGIISLSLRSLERHDDNSYAEREAKAAAALAASRKKVNGFDVIRFGLPFRYTP